MLIVEWLMLSLELSMKNLKLFLLLFVIDKEIYQLLY